MKIVVDGLSKTIKNKTVLRDISISFRSGEIYGIIGKNGSGKTMLLRALSGLIIPTKGQIYIDNKVLHRDIEFPPNVGVLIEKPSFLEYLTGFDNLKLLADINKIISDDVIIRLMMKYSLDPYSSQRVKEYSLGMKQKLGIIQAIMEQPDILILDEPTNGLDTQSTNILKNELKQFAHENKLIIVTSHIMDDIGSLCSQIYTIDNGTINACKTRNQPLQK